jgi:hypothetical protein
MKIKFLSAYSAFFLRIRRIRGKCLSVYGEYGKFRVVAVHKVVSEYAERIYAHMERTPRDTKLGIS